MKLFIIILLVFVLLMSVLVSWGFRYILNLPFKKSLGVMVLFNVLSVAIVWSMAELFRSSDLAAPLSEGAMMFITAEFIFAVLAILAVGIRQIFRRMLKAPVDESRRRFLFGGLVLPVAAGAAAVYGGTYERKNVVMREYDIPVGADFERDGYKIAQISDVHLGLFFSLDDFRELLEKTASRRPDALMVTGDIFDDVSQNQEAVKILAEYTNAFPDGIYFVWGNHEYMRGKKQLKEYLDATDIVVLENDIYALTTGNKAIMVVGVEYPRERENFESLRKRYAAEAMQKMPKDVVTIMLGHHPEVIDDGVSHNINLTLTGHTHGGQFAIFGQPIFPVFKYNRGLVKHGNCYGYVHSGNGSWFPVRIGCPPEIAYFNLRAQD